jgi:hypothetical protein
MAAFNSDQAKSKWQSLQNSAGPSLSAIVQGRGNAADFSRVASVLNTLNGLAAQVFAQAVSAADQQAKKFGAQYENILRDQSAKDLTAYEIALNEALATVAPDVIDNVREIIEASNDELTRTLGGRFDGLQEMMPPKDLPTTDDLLAANELLAEQLTKGLAQEDDVVWERRSDGIVAKVLAGFQSLIEQMAGSRGGSPSRSPVARAPLALAGPSGFHDLDDDGMDPREANLASHALAMISAPASHDIVDVNDYKEELNHTAASSGALTNGKESPTLSLSSGAEKQIQVAAAAQTDLYSKLLEFLTHTGKESEADEEAEEEKKADTWWRSFKNWSKGKSDKVKEFGKENSGWLGALGSALALAMLNPQIFKYFGDQIEKYLTWDNLKGAVGTAWDWVKDQGTAVIDWVLEKLHIGGTKPQAKLTSAAQAQVNAMSPTDQLKGIGGPKTQAAHILSMESTPGDPTTLSDQGKKLLASADPATKKEFESMKYDNESGLQRVERGFGMMGASISNAFSSPTSATRSSVTSTTNNNAAPTTAVDATNVTMKPGVTTNPPGVQSAAPGAAGTGDQRPTKGAPQMGSSSFGFQTGISDSLMMMNTPYFSG